MEVYIAVLLKGIDLKIEEMGKFRLSHSLWEFTITLLIIDRREVCPTEIIKELENK